MKKSHGSPRLRRVRLPGTVAVPLSSLDERAASGGSADAVVRVARRDARRPGGRPSTGGSPAPEQAAASPVASGAATTAQREPAP